MRAFDVRQGTRVYLRRGEGKLREDTTAMYDTFYLEDMVADPLGRVAPRVERLPNGAYDPEGWYGFTMGDYVMYVRDRHVEVR